MIEPRFSCTKQKPFFETEISCLSNWIFEKNESFYKYCSCFYFILARPSLLAEKNWLSKISQGRRERLRQTSFLPSFCFVAFTQILISLATRTRFFVPFSFQNLNLKKKLSLFKIIMLVEKNHGIRKETKRGRP
jgi:hypothetical protein